MDWRGSIVSKRDWLFSPSCSRLPEMETEKHSHCSILHFLCPPTLPLGTRTQSLSIVHGSITLHAGTSCEEFTWPRSKISWHIWQISCEIGDCRHRWRRKLWKKLDATSRFENFSFPFAQAPVKCGKNGPSMHVHWGIRVRQPLKVLRVHSSFGRAGEPTIALKWGGRTNRARNENRYAWNWRGSIETAREGNRKAFSPSILHFLCPPTLPLGTRTHKACLLSVDLSPCMWARRAKNSRGFDQRSFRISERSVVRSEIVESRSRRKFCKNLYLYAASRFESFFSLSLERQRDAGKTARRCTYTGASVFDRRQKFCESTARLDGLVNLRKRSNGVEGQIKPEIKRCGPTRVRANA